LVVAEKIRQLKRGRGGRGVWGEFRRARAKLSSPPPARQRGASQKNFLFLLEEKIGGAHKIKIVKKVFLRGRPPYSAAGGGLPKVRNF
jgi:hypothetical protein